MICITDHRTDPYFNLAAEEYLLKNSTEEYFMLWRNEPSIVVGKHQNALAEIDLAYARAHNFKIARRVSGGGTVFHDLGNLNFSFISNGEEGKLVNYRKFATPIVEVLGKLGIEAEFSKRDDIMIKGMKISGNASHVYKTRVLHHGTLLFSSHLSDLSKALKNTPDRYTDKAVKSVRSKVTNISQHLDRQMDVLTFRDEILSYVLKKWEGSRCYEYTEADVKTIEQLKAERFSTWEWNFGYSPKYKFTKQVKMDKGRLGVEMNVVGGKIDEIFIQTDFLGRTQTTELERMLTGVRHDPKYMEERLLSGQESILGMGLSAGSIMDAMI